MIKESFYMDNLRYYPKHKVWNGYLYRTKCSIFLSDILSAGAYSFCRNLLYKCFTLIFIFKNLFLGIFFFTFLLSSRSAKRG